jgi:hypothetical protein
LAAVVVAVAAPTHNVETPDQQVVLVAEAVVVGCTATQVLRHQMAISVLAVPQRRVKVIVAETLRS